MFFLSVGGSEVHVGLGCRNPSGGQPAGRGPRGPRSEGCGETRGGRPRASALPPVFVLVRLTLAAISRWITGSLEAAATAPSVGPPSGGRPAAQGGLPSDGGPAFAPRGQGGPGRTGDVLPARVGAPALARQGKRGRERSWRSRPSAGAEPDAPKGVQRPRGCSRSGPRTHPDAAVTGGPRRRSARERACTCMHVQDPWITARVKLLFPFDGGPRGACGARLPQPLRGSACWAWAAWPTLRGLRGNPWRPASHLGAPPRVFVLEVGFSLQCPGEGRQRGHGRHLG